MKIKAWKNGEESEGFTYWCQGCKSHHTVCTMSKVGGAVWGFNGNHDKPTFTPSVLVTSGHYLSHHKPGDSCWCTYAAEHPDEADVFKCQRCHTFITDGMVQFLGDCTHELAGQTLPLPNLPRRDTA